ncbi:hypothetical protein T02_8972 [Trichinella nativa]|uniref:Uncharacterized protein n=1 Tax=Trichinella nativa TaxID=6335 RepID=A0A0V1KVT2_9BILA|nr:hypothetical protein T02_8972 [Trichinella nativa]
MTFNLTLFDVYAQSADVLLLSFPPLSTDRRTEMKLFEMRRLSANTTKKNSSSSSISRMSNSGFS